MSKKITKSTIAPITFENDYDNIKDEDFIFRNKLKEYAKIDSTINPNPENDQNVIVHQEQNAGYQQGQENNQISGKQPDQEIDENSGKQPDQEIDQNAGKQPDQENNQISGEQPDQEIDQSAEEQQGQENNQISGKQPDQEIDQNAGKQPDQEIDQNAGKQPDLEIGQNAEEQQGQENNQISGEQPDQNVIIKPDQKNDHGEESVDNNNDNDNRSFEKKFIEQVVIFVNLANKQDIKMALKVPKEIQNNTYDINSSETKQFINEALGLFDKLSLNKK